MSKHTKGPYVVDDCLTDPHSLAIVLGYDIPGAGNPIVLGFASEPDEHGFCPKTIVECEANAKLFAASYDLAEACRAVVCTAHGETYGLSLADQLEAMRLAAAEAEVALAKAGIRWQAQS